MFSLGRRGTAYRHTDLLCPPYSARVYWNYSNIKKCIWCMIICDCFQPRKFLVSFPFIINPFSPQTKAPPPNRPQGLYGPKVSDDLSLERRGNVPLRPNSPLGPSPSHPFGPRRKTWSLSSRGSSWSEPFRCRSPLEWGSDAGFEVGPKKLPNQSHHRGLDKRKTVARVTF